MKQLATTSQVLRIKKSFNDRHPFFVPVVTLACLVLMSLSGFLVFGGQTVGPTDSKVVTLHIDGNSQSILTRASTVREFLDRSEVKYTPDDIVEPSLDSPIESETFSVNFYKARPVTVVDEKGGKVITKTAETTPAMIAKKAGFDLYPEDDVKVVEPDISLKQGVVGTQVSIDRATPVKINLYGTTYDIRTHAETVYDLMKERNIEYNDQSILPSPQTKLQDNQVVFVTQPGKQIVSSEEPIPNKEEVIFDTGLAVGQTQVRVAGSPGRKAIVYELTPSGQKVTLNEVIITPPTNRVVVKGKKVAAPNNSVAADKAALMNQAGISSDQQASADYIISRESGWRPAASNPSGKYVGLGQTNPAALSAACPNWQTDAVCQLRYFDNYAVKRYGSWEKAYAFWSVSHWW